MFITTKYKMFESNYSEDDIRLAEEIISKKDYIENEFEIKVEHRSPFREPGSRFFDLFKTEENLKISIGVYDLVNREFILFYSEGKELKRKDYLRIKSLNFFDGLDRVHYYSFIED